MNTLLTTLLPILLVGSVFSTIAGGGLGVIAVTIGSFFLPIQQNIAVMAVLLLGIQISKFLQFSRHARWNIVLWYILLGIPCAAAGGYLLFLLPATLIERAFGAVLLIVAVRDAFPKHRMRIQPKRVTLLISGAVNGFLGGIMGNAAIFRGQFLLALGLSKASFIGTSTAIALPMNLARSSVYLTQILWSQDILLLFILGIPLMFIGVTIGKHLLRHISTSLFASLQRVIIIVGAVRFLLF